MVSLGNNCSFHNEKRAGYVFFLAKSPEAPTTRITKGLWTGMDQQECEEENDKEVRMQSVGSIICVVHGNHTVSYHTWHARTHLVPRLLGHDLLNTLARSSDGGVGCADVVVVVIIISIIRSGSSIALDGSVVILAHDDDSENPIKVVV